MKRRSFLAAALAAPFAGLFRREPELRGDFDAVIDGIRKHGPIETARYVASWYPGHNHTVGPYSSDLSSFTPTDVVRYTERCPTAEAALAQVPTRWRSRATVRQV